MPGSPEGNHHSHLGKRNQLNISDSMHGVGIVAWNAERGRLLAIAFPFRIPFLSRTILGISGDGLHVGKSCPPLINSCGIASGLLLLLLFSFW